MKTIYMLIEAAWCAWEYSDEEVIALSEDKELLEEIAAGLYTVAVKQYKNDDVDVETNDDDLIIKRGKKGYDEGKQYFVVPEILL